MIVIICILEHFRYLTLVVYSLFADNGHYAYFEATLTNQGDTAIMESPLVSAAEGMCVQFWYNMYGRGIGALELYVKVSGSIPILNCF